MLINIITTTMWIIATFLAVSLVPFSAWRTLIIPRRQYQRMLAETRPYQRERERRELAERERKELRERRLAIAKLSHPLRRKIIESYAALGFRYAPRSWEKRGKRGYKKVEIRHTMIGDDYVVFRLDKLPDKTRPTDYTSDETMENLRVLVGRPDMTIHATPYDGLFLQVPLKGSSAGIPDLFLWQSNRTTRNAMELLPEGNSMLPIGQTLNRQFVYSDLRRQPHLLVAGSTGGGKSNHLNAILCALITRNAPHELKLVLIDMKRVEMYPYRNVPHLWRPVVTSFDGVSPVLREIREEMERRYALLSEQDLRNTTAWNEAYPERTMPRIICVFDEMADVMLDSEYGKEVTAILERLAAMTRAVDIHFILCTQRPSVNVVTGLIKSNITTRLAFRCASNTDSMVIIDNGQAKGLSPVGRGIFMQNGMHIPVQTPYIEDKQIETAIRHAEQNRSHRPPASEERLFTLMAAERPTSERAAWQLVADDQDATLAWHASVMAAWQYIPNRQRPIIDLKDGKRWILWHGRLVDATANLPSSVEEVEIMCEVQHE